MDRRAPEEGEAMDPAARRALIERYKTGYRAVIEALHGVTETELDSRPAPTDWSPRQVVHHLADSEMTSAIRLRRLIAEDGPMIHGYDEGAFARRLHYDRPIQASLEAFRAARQATGELLERLSESDWRREGTHSESGRYTVETWLEIYAAHAHDHAEQIRRARATASTRRSEPGGTT
jgi:hypothetical protein